MPDRESAGRLFRHARQEAIFVIVVFALALVWTVGYCYLYGYPHDRDSWVVRAGLMSADAVHVEQVAGLPCWVLYGIVAPWLACTVITVGFCLFVMKDDDLGAEADEGSEHGH